MSQKLGNLSVKTGEYTNQQNETKGRYVNAGVLMQGDDGGYYVLLNKTFNPAGVNQGDGKESVLLSCYQDQNNNQSQQQNNNYNQPPQQNSSNGYNQNNQAGQGNQQQYKIPEIDINEDEIPF